MNESLEAVAGVEEVAAPGETVGSVDLTTVSQQLDTIIALQKTQSCNQWALMGLILGIVIALIIGRLWK